MAANECSACNTQGVDCAVLQADRTVIIIGAGPSGLSAALHLQANNVNVTILEARSRPGGRVHTVHDALSMPVDFGAQLCTGMSPDVDRMAAPDPSALLARQVGVHLKELSSMAPLFDGALSLSFKAMHMDGMKQNSFLQAAVNHS
jgi:monoamine oxidase